MSRPPGPKRGPSPDGIGSARPPPPIAPSGYRSQYHAHAPTSSAVGSPGLTTTATSSDGLVTTAAAAASHRPPTVPGASSSLAAYAMPNGKPDLPRSSAVSEEVWAKAIHAVKIQKMSLRQAAQLYGVHHMSLHRRVRGRYSSTLPPSSDIRSFLTPDDEAEVLGVLREQFLHEKRITTDDIRFVVRAIASQGGKRSIPPEFPPSRWILNFKRAHGFVKLNSYAYPPSGTNQGGEQEMEEGDDSDSNYSGYSRTSSHQSARREGSAASGADQSGRRSVTGSVESNYEATDRASFNTPNGNPAIYDGGLTTGSSSGGSYENGESEKRTYKLSHTVPPETWEKAIAAVEQQGMSLRAAARMYGVHFAALHRRVKKRAQGEQSSGIEGYFQTDDEAGIIRVVVARAELGVLMTYDELMDLAQRAALRNLPDLSVEAARKLMTRFQTRNEHSIRHIIADWPSPRANPLTAIPRVVNNLEPSPRSAIMSGTVTQPRGLQPASEHELRGYASARMAASSMSELSHARNHQQNHDAAQSPLPPLRNEYKPPVPASSMFSRHLHSNGTDTQQRRPIQPPPSSAAAADHHPGRYINHDDRERRDHHSYDDHRSSYDEDHERRDSGDGSSDGDAVMFV